MSKNLFAIKNFCRIVIITKYLKKTFSYKQNNLKDKMEEQQDNLAKLYLTFNTSIS